MIALILRPITLLGREIPHGVSQRVMPSELSVCAKTPIPGDWSLQRCRLEDLEIRWISGREAL